MTNASGFPRTSNFGRAWLFLCLAFCAHVADEALTNFLSVYNPTVLAIRSRHPWFPMPTFDFWPWLIALMIGNLILLALTPLAYRNARWLRPFAYFYGAVHFVNGTGHTLGTIFGSPVPEVHFPRSMPGFYSSPLLLAASVYLFLMLRRSARRED